jgi:hypothetical protein
MFHEEVFGVTVVVVDQTVSDVASHALVVVPRSNPSKRLVCVRPVRPCVTQTVLRVKAVERAFVSQRTVVRVRHHAVDYFTGVVWHTRRVENVDDVLRERAFEVVHARDAKHLQLSRTALRHHAHQTVGRHALQWFRESHSDLPCMRMSSVETGRHVESKSKLVFFYICKTKPLLLSRLSFAVLSVDPILQISVCNVLHIRERLLFHLQYVPLTR